MNTDPNKATPAQAAPADDSLEAVLSELRQLARQTEPATSSRSAATKAPAMPSARPPMPSARPAARAAQPLRPADPPSAPDRVAFPPRGAPATARPRYARAGTWVVAGGVTLACAALAIPLRSMIFDPLREDAERIVGAEPALAKVEQRAPVEVAWKATEPQKEIEVAAAEPETAASSTTASLAGNAPVRAEPVLPGVEAPLVATSELIRAEAATAKATATQPVETASISLIKLPPELKPGTIGAVAVPPPVETASAAAVKLPPAAAPAAPAASAAAPTRDPARPTTEANNPKSEAPAGGNSPASGAVTDAAAQPANPIGVGQAVASGPTRVAALGPVPEPSPVAALIPSPPKPSAETLRIVDRAREMIRSGDISAARLLLERAVRSGSPQATFFLAETYDPQMLAQWGTFGIRGDVDKARDLYGRALKNGIADSKPRLEALR